MSTVTYRRLSEDYEPLFGQSQSNFLVDLDAVAQLIMTRLNLWKGEWWADLNDGLPMIQGILGKMGSGVTGHAALLIQRRILESPYVKRISNVVSTYNSSTRALTFSCTATASFGGTILVVGTYTKGSISPWTVTPQ